MAKTDSKKRNDTSWNFIDFVILLLAVICLIGAVIRGSQTDWLAKESDLTQYNIHFKITDIANTSQEALVIGDTVTLCESQTVLGTLKSIDSISPTTFYVKDADGNISSVDYPESLRIDVTGTILSLGKMSENGYLLGGTLHLAPGKVYRVQSEHMDFMLSILSVEGN